MFLGNDVSWSITTSNWHTKSSSVTELTSYRSRWQDLLCARTLRRFSYLNSVNWNLKASHLLEVWLKGMQQAAHGTLKIKRNATMACKAGRSVLLHYTSETPQRILLNLIFFTTAFSLLPTLPLLIDLPHCSLCCPILRIQQPLRLCLLSSNKFNVALQHANTPSPIPPVQWFESLFLIANGAFLLVTHCFYICAIKVNAAKMEIVRPRSKHKYNRSCVDQNLIRQN
jgi:hypothetical protein